MDNTKSWGGKREGAGRPTVDEKPKPRGVVFLDDEWALIRQKAEKAGLSTRKYIMHLVKNDN